jgi:signal transduction histidine kinase
VFAAVAEEVGQVLGVEQAALLRYEGDGTATVVADGADPERSKFLGKRLPLDGDNVTARVFETGRTAQIDDYPGTGALGEQGKERGVRSAVGCPIFVEGGLWGALVAGTQRTETLPTGVDSRIAGFAELAATAIADSEARGQVVRLAEEQAALRRVATLVAEGVPPSEVFAAVAKEVGLLLSVHSTHVARYGPDSTSTSVASWSPAGDNVPVGTVISLDDTSVTGLVLNSGRPERLDTYECASPEVAGIAQELNLRSSVGAPVIVDGRLWGAIAVSSRDAYALPPDTGSRITAFTELAATAISNAEARTETRRLAEEQAALRRVATLVAREAPASEVFAKVAEEVGLLLDIENVWVAWYEPDGNIKIVANWGELDAAFPVGTRLHLDGNTLAEQVRRAGRPVRIDDYKPATPEVAEMGLRAVVGSPIVVDGRPWGATLVATRKEEPMPINSESRIEEFTELVATAVSNLQARSELAASRARIVAATDEERRRVVRDLHDGAQQRLVHTVVTLNLARRALETEDDGAPAPVTEALEHAEGATAELRELAHGILPSVLTRGGLRAGVGVLATRMPVPVETGVSVDRLPPAVEATAYFIVAEALTNVAKHSHADRAVVTARVENGELQIEVRDDGVGGAKADGSGLLGLGDRLAVLDGTLRVESPLDGGTLVAATIPCASGSPEPRRPRAS